jgi:alpha-galactosidase
MYAQMWRISNDIWDGWRFIHEPPKEDDFPIGVRDIFDRLQPWVGQAREGRWPDADMLPWGTLAPHPGWGEARHSRLTLDEERTQFTLLAIARSPVILGANLTRLDEPTRALITNKEVIHVNQAARDNHPVDNLPAGFEKVRVWVAAGTGRQRALRYLAVFNLDDKVASVAAPWDQLGLGSGTLVPRDLWEGRRLPGSSGLQVVLPAHGCVLYALGAPGRK